MVPLKVRPAAPRKGFRHRHTHDSPALAGHREMRGKWDHHMYVGGERPDKERRHCESDGGSRTGKEQ